MRKKKVWIVSLGAALLFIPGGSGFLGPLSMVVGGSGAAWAAEEEAEYVGTDDCLDCHEELEEAFKQNIHSKTSSWDSAAVGCEDCHGAGSLHAESDGEVVIGSPAALEGAEADAACLSCHDGSRAQRYWQGSVHETENISCVSCHNIHSNFTKLLNNRSEARTCFECHPEQRTFLFKRSGHPMTDSGRRPDAMIPFSRRSGLSGMGCSSCHNPHGSQSEKLIAANSINDKCYECHREMQAPVLWEHSPVKENCLNCHNPHGSNYASMLNLKRPRLCQQCHEAGRHQTVAGEPRTFLVINRSCSNCHAQVHGSNHPSGLKLKR